MDNKIYRLHERCLRIIYNDKTLSFVELQEKNGSAIIHTRNVQLPTTETSKVYPNVSTELMREHFCVREIHYGLKYLS